MVSVWQVGPGGSKGRRACHPGAVAIDLPHPVGFVLGGGGSLGAAQVGMLQALAAAGLSPDLVVGTSVGALNGAVLAEDPEHAHTRLAELWASVRKEHIFPGRVWSQVRTLRSSRTFIYDNANLWDYVHANLRVSTFDQLTLPLGVVTTDVETAEAVVLTTGLVAPAVVASASIPGVFPPVWHNGRTLYDGGLVANVPIRQALDLGAKSLVVLDCNFPSQSWALPEKIGDVLQFVLLVVSRQQAALELPAAAALVPVVYLPGPKLRKMNPLDFSKTAPLLDGARKLSAAFLRDLHVDGPGLYGSLHAPVTRVE